MSEDLDPAEYVNPLFLKGIVFIFAYKIYYYYFLFFLLFLLLLFIVVRKSKVIYARWFDKKLVTLKMLYNIFSMFGNIDKMIYLKERSSALI